MTHIQFVSIFCQFITSVSPALEIYLDSRPLLSTSIAVSLIWQPSISPELFKLPPNWFFCFYPCFYTVHSLKSSRIILLKCQIMTLLDSRSHNSFHLTQSKSSNTYYLIKLYSLQSCCCSDTIFYHSPYSFFSYSHWFLSWSSNIPGTLKIAPSHPDSISLSYFVLSKIS